jgi:hypothetical protein
MPDGFLRDGGVVQGAGLGRVFNAALQRPADQITRAEADG